MIYVTGDTHGDQIMWDACITSFLKSGDTIIISVDFGIGFFNGKYWSEETFFDYLEEQEYTVLFCDGNHENFDKLKQYSEVKWHGGKVHMIRSNVIHLIRGEVYDIDGKKIFVMGGGYSLDKEFRTLGYTWWSEEMPSDEEYRKASENLRKNAYKVDYILTHTAPRDTVEYMSCLSKGIKNVIEEELPLTEYLNTFLQRFQNTWKIQILVSSIHCCHGQSSCRQNVEKRRKLNLSNIYAAKS